MWILAVIFFVLFSPQLSGSHVFDSYAQEISVQRKWAKLVMFYKKDPIDIYQELCAHALQC